jgi:hypothetical protein
MAQHAGVVKGLIYYFTSKRGYYLAIIEDSVTELVARAAGKTELPRAERVHRTIDGYLRYRPASSGIVPHHRHGRTASTPGAVHT